MKRYWISWWTTNVPDRAGFDFWVSGERNSLGDDPEFSICAVIDAKTEAGAWKKVQKFFGIAEKRFCDERDSAWLPPGDRFP